MFVYGDCVLNFIHLSAMGVAQIAESTNLKGCPHTFVFEGVSVVYSIYIMYRCVFVWRSMQNVLILASSRLCAALLGNCGSASKPT